MAGGSKTASGLTTSDALTDSDIFYVVQGGNSRKTTGAALRALVGKYTVTSTVAQGTAPVSVTSTTVCPNLNADKCDGLDVSQSGAANSIMATAANGNAGIATAPNPWASWYKALEVTSYAGFYGATTDNTGVASNSYFDGTNWKYRNNGAASKYEQNGGAHSWYYAAAGTAGGNISFVQAMSLDAAGRLSLGVGSTTAKLSVQGGDVFIGANTNVGVGAKVAITASGNAIHTSTPSGSAAAVFHVSNTVVGGINVTSSTTSYTTSSDYRLKSDVQPIVGALARVCRLNPIRHKWPDGTDGEGFLAHELQEEIPLAVSGTKDEVDDDGRPVYQTVDYSKCVPQLTAALQELKAENDELRKRLAVLEDRLSQAGI